MIFKGEALKRVLVFYLNLKHQAKAPIKKGLPNGSPLCNFLKKYYFLNPNSEIKALYFSISFAFK